MYLHCRHGFVEADAWDGATIPVAEMQAECEALARFAPCTGPVIVVRARRFDTLRELCNHLPRWGTQGVMPMLVVHESPIGWDYEYRCFLTAIEWGMCMTRVAMELDYRNFKHTAQHGEQIDRREYKLALAIWTAAHRDVERDKPRPAMWTTKRTPPLPSESVTIEYDGQTPVAIAWEAFDIDVEDDAPEGYRVDFARTITTAHGYSAPLVPLRK